MKNSITIPETISSRIVFKRKFSLREMYRSFVFLPGAISKMIENKKSKLVDEDFIRRLQLAVTEVNGCPACSYQHTKMALQQGMSNEEISSFLSGDDDFIKPEEAKAILFAQHFADSRGYPEKYAYDAIVKEYGKNEAQTILSAAQIMIAGNMYGIPYSAFQSRLKGKPFKDSTLFYELGMLVMGVVLLPVAILHGMVRMVFGFSNIKFKNSI
ncbi:carboxymuconolactone decarboxylase family protein [Membranicola marinus]|uniref:Carboxymuconolactone decarboxylase family protein n=1 Tax=Membranihabitans marinus TaxID=1227546 RepID=A0A953HYH8_9BACT|nr:carboxymuconolactone decarboxylase family protein [Membranihabitans marinus]MBY5958996.1 carboxymuconolactone decarboxylase family protein [Membranihabitans marinus]